MGGEHPTLLNTRSVSKFKEAQSVRMQLMTGKISKHQFDALTLCKYVVTIPCENCIIFFWPNHFRFGVLPQTQDSRLPNAWLMDANRLFLFTHCGQNLWFLTKFSITHAFFTAYFSNQKRSVTHLLGRVRLSATSLSRKLTIWMMRNFSCQAVSTSWNLPTYLNPSPKKDGGVFFLKAAQQEWIIFCVLKTTKRFACWVQILWCHQIPWIAAQEPLSPIRHEDKRSERQGRFGCFARGDGHGYCSSLYLQRSASLESVEKKVWWPVVAKWWRPRVIYAYLWEIFH